MTRALHYVLIGACLALGSACSSKKTEEPAKPAEQQAAVTPAPKPERPPKPEWQVPPPMIKKNVNATRIPVEEDFVAEAEERIQKNANLSAELDRLAKEINKTGG